MGEAHVPTRTSSNQRLRRVTITPTVDTSAYAAGDLVGGKLTFGDALFGIEGASGLLQTAQLTDAGQQDAALDLLLFEADPASTSFTDNAAFGVDAADRTKICARITLATYLALDDVSVARADNLALPIMGISNSTLYGALVSQGTPTYAADDLTLALTFLSL